MVDGLTNDIPRDIKNLKACERFCRALVAHSNKVLALQATASKRQLLTHAESMRDRLEEAANMIAQDYPTEQRP